MRTIVCLLVLQLSATAALARDIYVNNLSGDDTLTGRSERSEGRQNGPVRTIAKAVRIASAGDRIVLADTGEPYREQVTLQGGRNSGLSETLPFIFEGGGATIDGTVPVPDDAWEYVARDVFRFTPEVKAHQTFLLDGVEAVRVAVVRGAKRPELQPLQWCLVDGYIYFRVEPGNVPQQYFPSSAGSWTGITVYDVRHVVIRNVAVQGFALDGINAHDNAFGLRIEDTLAHRNGRSGYSIGGASRVRLEHCEAAQNHVAQLRTEGHCRVQLLECQLDEATSPAVLNEGGVIEE